MDMSKYEDRYELKKWYPSLPKSWKVGEIVAQTYAPFCYSSISSNINYRVNIPKEEVENNPEYWVKVEELCVPEGTKFKHYMFDRVYTINEVRADTVIIEHNAKIILTENINHVNKLFDEGIYEVIGEYKNPRNYEIYQMKTKSGSIITYKNGNAIDRTDDIDVSVTIDLDTSFKYGRSKIHAVKRLADDQIFTVGDKVTSVHTRDELHIIESFERKGNERIVAHTSWDKENPNGQRLGDIDNVELLFTTEDKVDIFEGDKCYVVSKKNLTIAHYTMAKSTRDGALYVPNENIYFSSEDKAEKWVDLNKPQYSKRDIRDTLVKVHNSTSLSMFHANTIINEFFI